MKDTSEGVDDLVWVVRVTTLNPNRPKAQQITMFCEF